MKGLISRIATTPLAAGREQQPPGRSGFSARVS
jgi:hypothetical protein